MSSNQVNVPPLYRDWIVVSGTTAVVAALVIAGWLLWPNEGEKTDDGIQRYVYMHCPKCMDEVLYNPKLAAKSCPLCDADEPYVPTIKSIFEETVTESTAFKLVILLLIAAVLVECLAYMCVVRLRVLRRRATVAQRRVLVCRCPFCNRRVGYPAAKAGTGITCPRCKTAFIAESGEAEPALDLGTLAN